MARGDKQIAFRVSVDELAKLQQAAQRAGISIPRLAKKAALGQKVKPQIIDIAMGKAINAELGKIGSNINQIARRLNSGDASAVAELAELNEKIDEFWTLLIDGKLPKMPKIEKTAPFLSGKDLHDLEESADEPPAPAAPAELLFKKEKSEQAERICPDCGGRLILKNGRNGKFYGCENYPKCRHTEDF